MAPEIRALALCGPTASGKSAIAVEVARAVGGEIVNADSRQIYAGMPIGTGWPSVAALRAVPHHLYGFVAPHERYSAGRYLADAARVIAGIAARGATPIVVGGTGFYIEALAGSMALDRGCADEDTRRRLRAEAQAHPQHVLHAWLAALDPVLARGVPTGDAYRTLRALEVFFARRASVHPSGATKTSTAPDVRLHVIVLDVDRAELTRRISSRVRSMFASGLLEEARAVAAVAPDAPALTGLGYAEAIAVGAGEASRDEAIAAAIRRTCAYAKRQRTWFRRMRDAVVVRADDLAAATTAVIARARENMAAT